jgi:hypothetical protein
VSRSDAKKFELGWAERQGLKLVGWRLKGMKSIKRWLPLIGTAVLAGTVVLRAFGQDDVAKAVETVGGLVGAVPEDPTVSYAELAAAAAGVAGVFLKVRGEYRKARSAS